MTSVIKKYSYFLGLILLSLLFSFLIFQKGASADSNFSGSSFSIKNTTSGKGTTPITSNITSGENGDEIYASLVLSNAGDAAIPILKLTLPNGLSYVDDSLEYYNTSWNTFEDSNFLTIGANLPGSVSSFVFVRFKMNISSSAIATYLPVLTITGSGADVSNKQGTIKVPMSRITSGTSGNQKVILQFGSPAKDDGDQSDDLLANDTYKLSINGGSTFTATPTTIAKNSSTEIELTFPPSTFVGSDTLAMQITGLLTQQNVQVENTASDGVYHTSTISATDTIAPEISSIILDSNLKSNGVLQITFNETMQTGDINAANVATKITLNNGHTLGASPQVTWTGTPLAILRIELGTGNDVAENDTMTIVGDVRDIAGNSANGKNDSVALGDLNTKPTVDSFTIDNNQYATSTINIVSFTGSDLEDLNVIKFLITETASTPLAGDFVDTVAPTNYTLTDNTEGTRTLYAWVKDNDNGISNSATVNFIYDVTGPTTTSNVASGDYHTSQTITLSCNDGVGAGCTNTYYTLDGSDPDSGSTPYTTTINISADTTLKYISYDNLNNTGAIGTSTYTFSCDPSTVANGTVAAYPTCTITCGSGYILSGNSCVEQNTGGGGGGGGTIVNTSTYNLSSTSSTTPVELIDREVQLPESGTFTRPVVLTNSRSKVEISFASGTEVKTADGSSYSGTIENAPKILKSKIPLAFPGNYKFVFAFSMGDEEILYFNPAVEVRFELEEEYQGKDTLLVYYYNAAENKYEAIETFSLSEDGKEIIIMLDHFSDYYVVDSSQTEDLGLDSGSTTIPEKEDIGEEPEEAEEETTFPNDIIGHWAEEYLLKLFNKNIMTGDGVSGLILPDSNLNRAEAVKMINFATNKPTHSCANDIFEDVLLDDWFCEFIAVAQDKNWINGYPDNTFRPGNDITRAETLKIILSAQEAAYDTQEYIEIVAPNQGNNFTSSKDKLVIKGVTHKDVSKVMVNNFTLSLFEKGDTEWSYQISDAFGNRGENGESMTYVAQAYDDEDNLLEEKSITISFSDTEDTEKSFNDLFYQDWHFAVIKYALDNNIVRGYEDETFRPNDPITRAEFAKILIETFGL